jgi:hypothetical protein
MQSPTNMWIADNEAQEGLVLVTELEDAIVCALLPPTERLIQIDWGGHLTQKCILSFTLFLGGNYERSLKIE